MRLSLCPLFKHRLPALRPEAEICLIIIKLMSQQDKTGAIALKIVKITKILVTTILMIGCTKTEYIYVPQEDGGGTTETPSLVGVWEWKSDPLIFISFDPYGRYAYCLGRELMASGTYTFDGSVVHLTNDMLNGKSENISITTLTKDDLSFEGQLCVWNNQTYSEGTTVNLHVRNFKRVQQPYAVSLAGTEWLTNSGNYFIEGTYYPGKTYFKFKSSWEGRRSIMYKKDGTWKESIKSRSWKYVFINNRLYRQLYSTALGVESNEIIVCQFVAEDNLPNLNFAETTNWVI